MLIAGRKVVEAQNGIDRFLLVGGHLVGMIDHVAGRLLEHEAHRFLQLTGHHVRQGEDDRGKEQPDHRPACERLGCEGLPAPPVDDRADHGRHDDRIGARLLRKGQQYADDHEPGEQAAGTSRLARPGEEGPARAHDFG